MLYSIKTGRYIDRLSHEKEFKTWRRNISDANYDKVCAELTNHFDVSKIFTSSWIPGHNWDGTVYEPLYHACGDNIEASGLFFGLIVYKLLMDRNDVWGFDRYVNMAAQIRQ